MEEGGVLESSFIGFDEFVIPFENSIRTTMLPVLLL